MGEKENDGRADMIVLNSMESFFFYYDIYVYDLYLSLLIFFPCFFGGGGLGMCFKNDTRL